jgi:hypothetical protein
MEIAKSESSDKQFKMQNIKTSDIDLTKLIDSMLLGRNKKQLRVLAAFLIKGIYETNNEELSRLMLNRMGSL